MPRVERTTDGEPSTGRWRRRQSNVSLPRAFVPSRDAAPLSLFLRWRRCGITSPCRCGRMQTTASWCWCSVVADTLLHHRSTLRQVSVEGCFGALFRLSMASRVLESSRFRASARARRFLRCSICERARPYCSASIESAEKGARGRTAVRARDGAAVFGQPYMTMRAAVAVTARIIGRETRKWKDGAHSGVNQCSASLGGQRPVSPAMLSGNKIRAILASRR